MAAATDLLDVNVWLALAVPDHPHHPRARRYWEEEAGPQLAFCRVTSLALVRLLTQPAVMGDDPLDPAAAWTYYRDFTELKEVIVADEPPGLERYLGSWATGSEARPRLWTDAYLAAFAQAGAFRLVTFDGDFRTFPGLRALRLVP
ncbi:MAG: TA system VapC family ribonuclease toxin [Acidobacteriota bacterium]